MLDSEHPETDQSADAAATPATPPRRRRAASRPAGPPASVEKQPDAEPPAEDAAPSEEDATVPADVPENPTAEATPAVEPVTEEPAADTPAEEPAPAPKRTRRSRAKVVEPAQATLVDVAAAVVPESQPEPVAEAEAEPVAEPKPATRRRRATRPVEAAPASEVDAAEVAASLAELAQNERPRSRRRVKAETFGLGEEATPDQVLDSLAAAIGGLFAESVPVLEPAAEEPAENADELEEDETAEDELAGDELPEGEDEGDAAPRRRRRRRGGRRRRRGAGDGADDENGAEDETEGGAAEGDAEAESGDEPAGEGGSRRRRRRRRRGEDSGDGDEDGVEVVVRTREPRRRAAASDEVTGIEGSTRMEAKKQRRREGRAAGRRRTPILSESEFLARRESVERTMLIRQAEDYSQIAVMEDGILVEHYVDRASATSMIGNIYLGRVQNVLPSMEAAFVDIGRGRNAVLYAGEVDWDSFGVTGADKKVEKVFKSGQQVLVQVSKDPVGAKGARLTSHISIPGRYIVYSPGGHLSGISRKLPEGERKRLKGILDELIEPSASVIVRTAAEGASEDELVRDVNRLKAQWEVLETKVKAGQAPQLLYAEPDLTVRIVRDLFTEDFSALVIDGNGKADDAFDTVEAYVTHVAPHLAERLKRWNRAEQGDIFDAHRVHEQVLKALERKVFLPSGGSLIVDRTEAMTVIDVNTGKFTGTSGNLEATVTSNNLEAAEEIVRQLRLRDIGGIIVIDFIDMVLPANRELLLRRLVECLGRDRTRHQVAEVTSLGLVQMTRKKIGTGLAEAFTVACETCKGRGYHVHDAPVASQAPADGGDRDGSRRGGRGGNQTTRRSSRARKDEAKPVVPSPALMPPHAPESEPPAEPEPVAPEPVAEPVPPAEPDSLVAPDSLVEPKPLVELVETPVTPVAEIAPVEEPVVVEAELVEPEPVEASAE
nr:Rne/Rng family ribonuclease [Propionicimonas sp.]